MVDRTRADGLLSPLEQDVALARAVLAEGPCPVAQCERTRAIVDRFVGFAEAGYEVESLAGVSSEVVGAFVRAPKVDLSVATMHWRRTALRLLFRAARAAGVASHDPTLDLRLPPRSSVSTRPLTDDEVELCRASAQWSLTGSRHAATWALAEATCRSSELPHITSRDLDLVGRAVRIHGGKLTDNRVGRLSDWAVPHLERRLEDLDDRTGPLLYAGDDPAGAGQASSARAVVDVLTRAGLYDEADVRPAAVAAWAGRRVFDDTARIDIAARVLGVRSLDQAARMVVWDWRADEVHPNP